MRLLIFFCFLNLLVFVVTRPSISLKGRQFGKLESTPHKAPFHFGETRERNFIKNSGEQQQQMTKTKLNSGEVDNEESSNEVLNRQKRNPQPITNHGPKSKHLHLNGHSVGGVLGHNHGIHGIPIKLPGHHTNKHGFGFGTSSQFPFVPGSFIDHGKYGAGIGNSFGKFPNHPFSIGQEHHIDPGVHGVGIQAFSGNVPLSCHPIGVGSHIDHNHGKLGIFRSGDSKVDHDAKQEIKKAKS